LGFLGGLLLELLGGLLLGLLLELLGGLLGAFLLGLLVVLTVGRFVINEGSTTGWTCGINLL
jgi:hypothetical protein